MTEQPPRYKPSRALAAQVAKARTRASVLEELGEVGEHRHEALRAARRDLNKIGRLARKGLGADMTLSEIAETAGISRVTLDKLLDKKPRGARLKKAKP